MGTRSSYRFREIWTDKESKKKKINDIVLVYFQFDGYPSGHPKSTAEWLAKGTVVNGIDSSKNYDLLFNGVGCMAAQFIAENKQGAGGLYLYPIKARGKCCENYLYDITVEYDENSTPGPIIMSAYSNNGKRPKLIWSGNPKNFDECIKIDENE